MVGKTAYSSVPTAVELENNSNQKKYTVNRKPGGLVISKALCTLMAIGALLLAVLVGLLVFFLVPRPCESSPQSLLNRNSGHIKDSYENGLKDNMADDERLPTSIDPTFYRIQIMSFLNNLTTNGVVTISLNVKEDTNEIVFHVKDIDVDKESVKVKAKDDVTPLEITDQNYIKGEKYQIILAEPLVKNQDYTLRVQFVGHINSHLQGLYRSQYGDPLTNTTKYLASTQFSPTDARRAFPCFDEPSFKANFSISIARLKNTTSISNMPLERTETDLDRQEWEWDHFYTTPKMPTYLVAFIVSDLQPYGASDMLIKLWATKHLISQTRYAADLAGKILHFFEDYFTIKFPLPKIDIVAVPEFGFSAMENWGLITFRESVLLFDQQQSHIDNKRDTALILSHELGHQWFGNLVTPKWWKDLWLKEGFATYLEYIGIEFAEPTWNIQEEFILSETNRAFALDALESSRAISFDVNNNKQIRQTFDELSYGKGACIIRMMNHFLGEKTFKIGLIEFLQKYKYANADRNDLFKTLTEEAHKSGALDQTMTVKDIMDSWTEQPGFPVITAIMDHSRKKLNISQKRFLFANNNDNNATWWVPISITTKELANFGNTKPLVWLKNERKIPIDISIPETDWYLLNVNQTGYYIVNYDENNWKILTQQIMELPTLTRAQLISDSMDLARANLLDYDIPLRMISRMARHDREIMFVPTSIALHKLEFLNDVLSTTPAYGLFEEFHYNIFEYAYWTVQNDRDYYIDNYLVQRIRRCIMEWSCKKSGSSYAVSVHHMFRQWMEQDVPVPPNLRDIVYCTAIREGTEAEWKFAYKKYLQTTSISEKNILLDALGCTTKKWLLSGYLNFLLQNNSSIRIQDGDRVFKSVSDNSEANTLAFDFLRSNWNNLLEHYGEGFNIISRMVKSLPKYMNTEFQLSELIRFKDDIKNNIGTASQAFDSAIEKVRGNVEWMKKNYESVETWFNDHKNHYNTF